MSTTVETKRFTLEAKPATDERPVTQPLRRVTDDEVAILIRLPDLTSHDSGDTSLPVPKRKSVAADESVAKTGRGSKRRKKSKRNRSKSQAARPANEPSENDPSADQSWTSVGWQILVGLCLCGVFGLAYAALTSNGSNGEPAPSGEQPNDLFIELPAEKESSSQIVTSDDEPDTEPFAIEGELVESPLSVVPAPTPEPEGGDFEGGDFQQDQFDVGPIETESPKPALPSETIAQEPPPSDTAGQFETTDPAPFETQPVPRYPTTDPSAYPAPRIQQPAWRTGDQNIAPTNDSVNSGRFRGSQPGVATLQGTIQPPPDQRR